MGRNTRNKALSESLDSVKEILKTSKSANKLGRDLTNDEHFVREDGVRKFKSPFVRTGKTKGGKKSRGGPGALSPRQGGGYVYEREGQISKDGKPVYFTLNISYDASRGVAAGNKECRCTIKCSCCWQFHKLK